MEKYLDFLHRRATDKVRNINGVITSLSFDATGCIQVCLVPVSNDGTRHDGYWVDISVIEIQDGSPVAVRPDWSDLKIKQGLKGSSLKPGK